MNAEYDVTGIERQAAVLGNAFEGIAAFGECS